MNNLTRILGLFLLTSLGVLMIAPQGLAQSYQIENGTVLQPVGPLSKAENAAAYYTYNTPFASSGDPDFGTVSSVGFIWLYENSLTGDISLGMIFDKPQDGSGGSVNMTIAGVPATGFMEVSDDPSDAPAITGGTWGWSPCCTDGGVIGGLKDSLWEITITLDSATGVGQWFFLNGPSAASPDLVPLNMTEDLVIAAVPTPTVVKWRQPPDMQYGVNIRSTEPEPLVADDWRCTDPRPVTDVHFWGSFIGWERDNPSPTTLPPMVEGFWIRIYKDVPAGVDPEFPYSHPGDLLNRYEVKIDDVQQEFVASIELPDETFEHKFYYSLDLSEPFVQEEGTIYWIAISAIMSDTNYPWGWETSTRHWNDNASRFWIHNNYWEEITPHLLPSWYQEQYQTVDMAFELSVPHEPPPPPPEMVKWQQRPDMVHGINVASNPKIEPPGILTVADDWLCLGGSPVADLHFWGSYLKWNENEPEPPADTPGVEAFRIRIFSDRPAIPGTPDGFSRPDLLLYEGWVDTYNETYVASIPIGPGQLYEHKFKYDLDLPRIFWQKRNRVYWLNISAIPRNPEFQWGWESSMDRWNDFAVEGYYLDPMDRNWRPIFNPLTDEFVDMSFELTTCKGPIKWLQFPDMANGFNVPAFRPENIVADDWLCREGKPITEVHFWGSYLTRDGREHWQQDQPEPTEQPPGVEAFRLSFHQDVPAGVDPDMPWSHPGELLREVRLGPDQVSERYWDSIPHVDATGERWWEHKFYYIVKLEEPFEQNAGNVYWLDISALPAAGSNFVWGWETSQDHWNDDAVRGDGRNWKNLGHLGSDFDDLVLGTTYVVGQTFTTNGIPVSARPFQYSSGNWTSGGNATVVALGQAGGSGKEIEVNNVNLELGIDVPLTGLSLQFGEYGGNLNIRINGDLRNFGNFADIHGLNIGGVQVSVVNGLGNDIGILRLEGQIHDFAVGGQEFYIDDLQTGPLDMAFLLYAIDETDVCEGDFDRDGDVDRDDLEVFADDYGRNDCYITGDCEADFKYDGDVDGPDLKVFIDDYGRDDCPCRLPPFIAP